MPMSRAHARVRSAIAAIVVLSATLALTTRANAYTPARATNRTSSAQDSLVAASLVGIVSRGQLSSLRWSNLAEVDAALQRVYAPRSWTPMWSDGGRATPSALGLIASLSHIAERGLRPTDYDVERLSALAISSLTDIDQRAEFDLTLSVAAVRALRALYFGRIDAALAHPTLHITREPVELATIVSALVLSSNPDSIFDAAEPQVPAYQHLKTALSRYRARVIADSAFGARVTQIEATLERWRWLPRTFAVAPVIVNIPAFELEAWNADSTGITQPLRMDIVAGSADGHQTPIIADSIRFIDFAPYWIVPLSIAKSELMPLAMRDPHILTVNNYEVVSRRGRVMVPTVASLRMVLAGTAFIRQLPGGTNSLGKVKFMFPNTFDVYLHDSPVASDFLRVRRDQSHGCVRISDPRGMAMHLLRDQPEWTTERIDIAMNGRTPTRVPLTRPVPVFLFYATAVASTDGTVRFHDDIYGFDAALSALLSGTPPSMPSAGVIGAESGSH